MEKRGRLSRRVRDLVTGDSIRFHPNQYEDQDTAQKQKWGDQSDILEIRPLNSKGRAEVQFRVINGWLKPVDLCSTIDIPEAEAERLGIVRKNVTYWDNTRLQSRTGRPTKFRGVSID